MMNLINDIYPGSSTHEKVVFREVLHPIELEFRNVGLQVMITFFFRSQPALQIHTCN